MFWERLNGIFRRRPPGASVPPERWVVIDCETTGLDPRACHLLSVAAVAVRHGVIDPNDSFESALRPQMLSDRGNVLVHGMGFGSQSSAPDPLIALTRLIRFIASAPVVAFHARFDQTVLMRALRAHCLSCPGPWLDLAQLAPALIPNASARALDEWLDLLHIPVFRRHTAVGDAFATAMLLTMLQARARPAERSWHGLTAIASQSRWLTHNS